MSLDSTASAAHYVAILVHATQQYVAASPGRAILLGLFYTPVLIFVLNILKQLVVPRDPSLPPEVFHWIPFIGSSITYGNDPLNFFFKCREKHGDVFTFTLLGRKVTVALGAKGNNFVLGGKSTAFSAEDAYTHLTTPVFGKDVYSWSKRSFVKVGLSTENFRAYVSMFEQEVDDFMRSDQAFIIWQMNDINEWGRFDVTDIMAQITILTASRTLQGKEVRSGLDKSFSALYNDLDGGFTPLNFMFPNLPLESYRRRDAAQKKMSKYYTDIICKRRESGHSDEPDMISALMDQKYRDGRPLRDHEIAHIMIALLMAGQHSSSASGSWTLLHLAHNVEVQEALYQEQVDHFGNPDGSFRPMTYEGFRKLPVLDSVIRETLRMHPPIHSIMRYVRSDVPIPATLAAPSKDGVYVVPKGYYVLASAAVSQVDPRIWANPMKWDPTRWSDPEGVAAQAFNTYSDENGEKIDYGFGAISKGTESPYQPFGAGRHRCIGEQFAYLQLGVVISNIIRKVEVRLEDSITEIPAHNYHTMITMPKKPRNICYRRRRFD
ncbi:cytochrome P450 [Suillus subalutaceus]|uniref:cytochrome P450 n=1 Tax=Suillus subalutaceus TaxID=48586 RepID=UPI001B884CC8|nr:cytochrome P450 [Suillus subalutaceus]KAG1832339.1 cytochrome P450 [Suillus subalutaceus]